MVIGFVMLKFFKNKCSNPQKNNNGSKVSFKDPEVDKVAIIDPESTKSFLIPSEELKKQLTSFSKNKTFSEYADIKNWI
jgi:ABC-type phosphate/phosphonate transport system substrate-binding protein